MHNYRFALVTPSWHKHSMSTKRKLVEWRTKWGGRSRRPMRHDFEFDEKWKKRGQQGLLIWMVIIHMRMFRAKRALENRAATTPAAPDNASLAQSSSEASSTIKIKVNKLSNCLLLCFTILCLHFKRLLCHLIGPPRPNPWLANSTVCIQLRQILRILFRASSTTCR